MTRHSARATLALRALGETDPALAALALWCDHRDRDDGPPAETCGSTIRYAPGFDALPPHEQIGLAAHHILHVALRHSQRLGEMQARLGDGFDPALYNIAADAIINEALLLAGYALPRPALTLTGVLQASLGSIVPAAQALAEWDADRLYIRLMQGGPGKDGTAARARAHAASRLQGRDMRPAASPDRPGKTDDAADWRQHLSRALEAGRMAGRGIGVLGHRMADIPEPRTPWEVILRRLVTRVVTQAPQPTHRRPARGWIAAEAEAIRSGSPSPAFQPGQQRSTVEPRIVVALDTSSSIDDTRLALFMAEVAGIAQRCRAEVWLIPFDEAVQAGLRLDPAGWRRQLAALALPRGGGTSFVPMLAQAVALAPSIIVVLTDLEGDFGPAPRGVPVIWAVPEPAPPPPFGQMLDLAR
ncbi:VWA-like domain-containing protein [Paracoccaceae bacterium Fryx2]|nr:VWA-like domain-containing protein [Paracoccaceae bacterium Fryx2]